MGGGSSVRNAGIVKGKGEMGIRREPEMVKRSDTRKVKSETTRESWWLKKKGEENVSFKDWGERRRWCDDADCAWQKNNRKSEGNARINQFIYLLKVWLRRL